LEQNVLLKFENVSKNYANGVQALKNVTLEIESGEFVAIIGPSGAGKSTVLRCINKMIDASEGKIFVEGQEITRLHGKSIREVRRKVGMIFQNYNLVYRLSVMQNVLHGRLGYMSDFDSIFGHYKEEDKIRAVELLSEIGLHEFMYNRAGELSGGQKQRVGIARAFMQNPKILLCDEPISSLDPSSSKIVMDNIYDLSQKHHIACIVNLHQIDVALNYATRIIGLCDGQVVYDGSAEGLSRKMIEEIYHTSFDNLIVGNGEKYGT